jgi:membrane-associated phospholipid phosphatase
MIQLWDAISLISYGLGAYPFIRYYDSFEMLYIKISIGLLVLVLFIKFTRILSLQHRIFLSPIGAIDCNMSNKGGPCEGNIGMPSGHVSIAAYIVGCLILLDKRPSLVKNVVGIVVVCLIGFSRYAKRCHTFYQLVAGALTGSTFAYCVTELAKLKIK